MSGSFGQVIGNATVPGMHVGFYWILPVNRTGFRSFPCDNDVDFAAKKSRTIRYQRERIKWKVDYEKSKLAAEYAFIDVEQDRGTDAIYGVLDKVSRACKQHSATMLYVKFSESHFWRPHLSMEAYLKEKRIPTDPLDPVPIFIDGREFDPVKHFRRWRERHEREMSELVQSVRIEFAAECARIGNVRGKYQAIANALNARNVTTTRSLPWTMEGVRKAYGRQNLD